MMINVDILSDEKVMTLKSNIKEVQDNIFSSKNNEWIKDFFKEENPFIKSKLL